MLTHCLKKQKGYSLIELVVTIALSSIVLAVFLQLFSRIQLQSTEPVFQVKAAELGQAYLEEIALKKFDHNSPSGNGIRCNESSTSCSASLGVDQVSPGVNETRANFNDIDDYNGLNNSPPIDALGNTRTGFNGYSVQVSVSYAGSDLGLDNSSMKKVEVTVTTPDNTQYTFSQYRGNF